MASGTLIAPGEPLVSGTEPLVSRTPARRGDHRCECGHILRVLGGGRHRVYFEPSDASLGDPVMNRTCPQCGRDLPGKN